MPTLVFDIESSAYSEDLFDEAQSEYLFRSANKLPDEVDRQAKRDEISSLMNLWPFTAQVVCIGMLNSSSQRGQVLYISEDFEDSIERESTVKYVACMDEVELLTAFWEVAGHYDSIVTFNGRAFDVPFLYLRSALLNVPISAKNWLGFRFQTEPHCDLAEQLSFYGVSGREGAARRFNLDFYCRAFGIESPKSAGVTGLDVKTLFSEGRHREIAEYCMRDVVATLELYQVWAERLKGIK
jgi:DNA polymerase elongation subunit (family B)